MSMTRSTYSEKLKDALDELRPEFQSLGKVFAEVTKKRAEIAPTFHKAFILWKRETRRSFIAFVHELDASVPVNNRKAYRSHASYRAAYYLQELATGAGETKRRGMTPLAALAVTIKSVLPLCGSQRSQKEALTALLAATKWRDADQSRLLAKIRRARAVALPGVPRLVDTAKSTKEVVVDFERERISA